MNSLGSWIDRSELDRLVAAVGTKTEKVISPEPASQAVSQKGPHIPHFNWHRPAEPAITQPVAAEEPVSPPAPERFPVPEEVEKFRNKVAAIKDKARSLGVLAPGQQAPLGSPPAAPQPAPPAPGLTKPAPTAPRQAPRIKVTAEFSKAAPPSRGFPGFRPPQGPLRLRLECFGEWAATVSRAQSVIVADSQGDLVFERGADPAWVSSVSVVASAGEMAGRHLALSGNTLIHIDLSGGRKLAVIPCQTKFGHLSVGLVVPSHLSPEIAHAISDAITSVVARN